MIALDFKDGRSIPIHETTLEQRVSWINEAEDFSDRQKRKQFMLGFNYSAGTSKLIQLFGQRKLESK